MRIAVLALIAGLYAGPILAQPIADTDCDHLAGLWLMPRAEGLAQVYQISDPAAAITACEAAVTTFPDQPYFKILLARALLAAQPDDPGVLSLLTGIADSLPALSAWQIGALYEFGEGGLSASETSARDNYQRACDLWPEPAARPGCAELAVMMIEGRGGPDDATGGFAMLDNVCRAGWAMACTDMALQQELRGTANEAEISEMLEHACVGGDFLGCSLLGFRFETETGAPFDMTRARALYTLACDGGEMHGCANLGEVYRSGLGVAPDVGRAVALFDMACNGNDPFACATLGDILADGRGAATDIPRAIEALDRACWLGDPEACDRADSLR